MERLQALYQDYQGCKISWLVNKFDEVEDKELLTLDSQYLHLYRFLSANFPNSSQ